MKKIQQLAGCEHVSRAELKGRMTENHEPGGYYDKTGLEGASSSMEAIPSET